MLSIQLAVGIFGITFMSILLVVLPEDDGVDRGHVHLLDDGAHVSYTFSEF